MQLTGHVLIVDDEPHVRHYISLIVRTLGPAVVHQAGCGEAALPLFHALDPRPELVILDINMPGMGGVETLRQLRKDGVTCPIVMLTSLAMRQTVEDVLEAGGTAFIRKDTPRAEITALLGDVWKSYINHGTVADEPATPFLEARSTHRVEEVLGGAHRGSPWDQDWFRGGV